MVKMLCTSMRIFFDRMIVKNLYKELNADFTAKQHLMLLQMWIVEEI